MSEERKPFCKIYIHEKYGQVLALKTSNEDGVPYIRVMFDPQHDSLEMAEFGYPYEDSEEGEAKRDEIFQKYIDDDSMFEAAVRSVEKML